MLALVVIGGQLLGVAHQWLVPHVVCPEHGDLVHIHDVDALFSSGVSPREPLARAYRSASHAAADSHDHCLIFALRREQPALRKASSTLIPVCASQPAVRVEHANTLPCALELLLLAPKGSPPLLLA